MNELIPANFSHNICELFQLINIKDDTVNRFKKCFLHFEGFEFYEQEQLNFIKLLEIELINSEAWKLFQSQFKHKINFSFFINLA